MFGLYIIFFKLMLNWSSCLLLYLPFSTTDSDCLRKSEWVASDKTGSAYFDKDYIVASFNNDNELVWMRKVPRRLRSTQNNYYSEKYIVKENNLYILHFDSEDNFNNPDDVKNNKRQYIPEYLVIQKLDENGELSGEPIFNTLDLKFTKSFVPYNFLVQNNDGKAIFLFYSSSSAAFLKVEINE